MVQSNKIADKLWKVIITLVLGLSGILCIAPIINTLAISLSDSAQAVAGRVTFWPVGFSLNSYAVLLDDKQFLRSFLVSLERVLLGGGINVALCILMAYPLSKSAKEFKWRNYYMWIIVFTMLFSGGLIPWYYVITKVGIQDTIWALVLPGAVQVFSVIILMNYIKGIPKELEEAATVDGAGPIYILVRIIVPLALPSIATIALFSIVFHWNSFFDGIILINTQEKIPLQTYIQRFVVQPGFESMNKDIQIKLSKLSNSTLNASKVIISMIPVLCVYPFLQRYFIHGLVMGAVKE